MSWHADPDVLARYAEGRLEAVGAISIEAHLPACEACRARLGTAIESGRVERAWREVTDILDRPQPGPLERLLLRLGVPEGTARLAAVTPTPRSSWFLAIVLALGSTVGAARLFGDGLLAFLVVAPLLPVAGVALAYGPAADPAYEVGLASPIGGFRLTLIRTTAVVVASIALIALAAMGLPDLGWAAGAWLVPSLALAMLTLALSSSGSPSLAAGAISTLWVAAVTLSELLATEPLPAFEPGVQAFLGLVALCAAVLVFARRKAFEVRIRV